MPGPAVGGGDAVKVTLEGSHLRVDARPARMVSLLKGTSGGEPVVSARRTEGGAHTQAMPRNARQATFRIRDDMTVEAARTADFVAIAEESGRCLVVAFSGEVTVLPRGDGDRFALGAHEALIVPAGKGEPRVVSTDELSGTDQADVDAVLDAAADAVLAAPAPAAAAAPATAAPATATPAKSEPAKPEPAKKAAPAPSAPAKKAAAPVTAAAQGGGGGGGGGRRKKGKKGRPQPPRPQKAAAAKKAAAAGAAAGAAKVAAGGGAPPTRPPSGGGGGGGGRGGGGGAGGPGKGGGAGGREPEPDETPRDRRILIGAGLLAVIAAIVVLALTSGNDGGETIATDATTTTETTEAPTTTVPTTATITTAPAAATTTTARPTTTTTVRATTTTAAPKADFAVAPKSCVQEGRSITYTAAITNKANEPYDFTISVSFRDGNGAEVATATANVSNLASGRTADFSAKGTSTKDIAGSGQCHVTNIDAKPSS